MISASEKIHSKDILKQGISLFWFAYLCLVLFATMAAVIDADVDWKQFGSLDKLLISKNTRTGVERFSSGDLSSDLKPLDNVWFQIIHKLKNKHFQTIPQLFKTTNIKWNNVDLSFHKRLSASLTITDKKETLSHTI